MDYSKLILKLHNFNINGPFYNGLKRIRIGEHSKCQVSKSFLSKVISLEAVLDNEADVAF